MLDLPFDRRGPRQCRRVDSGVELHFQSGVFCDLAEHEELLPFITPSFRRRLEASRKLLTEDAPLFEWLFEANPMSQESIRQYRSFLNVAAGGDVNVLVQRAQWWWKEAR